ncbi:hypothetical protein C1I98_05305 [Spongiactinospora gelatinilytica]|uniref:DUF998 domain-containing protein n=1 Tax=Spongiactinospora gelatinilytica TaxID=2666298 RepID=A0A2W2GW78_9ACTN|nr:DUF998 domain-containing protein [Spongiactinospora gelatinilytica]PZG53906.1 hypothetical protein C1I98_05305 [Spongiactinospora gelatinilytica]
MGIEVQIRTKGLVVAGFAAVVTGAVAMLGLHLTAGLDPMHGLISEYAFAPAGWLLGVSLTCFAAGAALFAMAMVRSAGSRRVALLVAAWGACMMLVGAFPTDRPGVPLSMSGGIHRYAALVAFLAMPLAGLILARLVTRDRWATAMRVLCGIALVCLVAVVVPYALRFVGIPVSNDDIPAGLTQRLVVVTELGVLVLLGRSLLLRCRDKAAAVRRGAVGERAADKASALAA